MLEQLCHPYSTITKEGKWQSTTFYDSLGTEPLRSLCTSNSAVLRTATKEAAIGSFSFPFQGFNVPPRQGQNRAQEETSHIHLYQHHMDLSNDKLSIMNEINILFLTQLPRGKKLRLLSNTSLRCMKITQVGCKEAKMPHDTSRNEEDWEHFWTWIMLDFSSS